MQTPSAPAWSAAWLASQSPETRRELLSGLDAQALGFLARDWRFWARADQLPPPGDWTVWLFLGGRGAGKTRAGAEFILDEIAHGRAKRAALVGETLHDARMVMVEGVSGLLACAHPKPEFEPSKRRLTFANGAVAEWFSAEEPDSLRGPQFDLAWCDEFAKWREPQAVMDMLAMALRLGERPRKLVTTTPRNIAALKTLMSADDTALTRARTADNAANLAPVFLKQVVARFAGTALGRQELDGDILEDDRDALFRRAWIDAARVRAAPELERVVIAVDPPVTSGPKADACGIVAAGRAGGDAYVLADRTQENATPLQWASEAARAYADFAADAIVVEVNQGGDLVKGLLKRVAPQAPVRSVRATRSKTARAEPVAMLYEQSRVHHVRSLPHLEDEMCTADGKTGKSPDRTDALVWALTHLLLDAEAGAPRVRGI
jgi:phage terminase large subunit-like protein